MAKKCFNLISLVLMTILLSLTATGSTEEGKFDGANQLFTIRMEIDFEVEEINIPGWEGGIYSEVVGAGQVETRLVFPPGGGFPSAQAGDAKITRYGCMGSAGCICTAPPETFSRLWTPVIFEDIQWDKEHKKMTIKGPLTHPEDTTKVRINCGGMAHSVEEHPLYKLLGALGKDNAKRRTSGFQIPLAGSGPWKKTFDRELYAMGPKVFRARILVTINTPESRNRVEH